MKCERCGHGVGLTRRGQPIADGYICYKCLDELGFDKKCRSAKRWTLSYWEIKDGPDRISENRLARFTTEPSVKISHYGEERDLDCTDEEAQIFEELRDYIADAGLDPDELSLVRKSDNYVSAVYKDWDLARFKYTQRAKWISFPSVEVGSPKHRIEDPSEAVSFEDLLADSLAMIEKYT